NNQADERAARRLSSIAPALLRLGHSGGFWCAHVAPSAIRPQPAGWATKARPRAGGPEIAAAFVAAAHLGCWCRFLRFMALGRADEARFCPVRMPRKAPSGRSLYRTRRSGRSPSLSVHVAASWNER